MISPISTHRSATTTAAVTPKNASGWECTMLSPLAVYSTGSFAAERTIPAISIARSRPNAAPANIQGFFSRDCHRLSGAFFFEFLFRLPIVNPP